MKAILTIGVYGANEEAFFKSLTSAGVTDFCDIRARRGMRGSTYAFVNKTRLTERLKELGIRYHHYKELAPTSTIREAQKRADSELGAQKRTRSELGSEFIDLYEETVLAGFDAQEFAQHFNVDSVVCFFCVEARPDACHRSLVAKRLGENLGLDVLNLYPGRDSTTI